MLTENQKEMFAEIDAATVKRLDLTVVKETHVDGVMISWEGKEYRVRRFFPVELTPVQALRVVAIHDAGVEVGKETGRNELRKELCELLGAARAE